MTARTTQILDANYQKANLKDIVQKCSQLKENQKEQLYKLLKTYEQLFDGTLGEFRTSPVSIKLKPDATPFHGKAYPIPHIHEKTLKKECERLCKLKV